jgi:hypothetical protein
MKFWNASFALVLACLCVAGCGGAGESSRSLTARTPSLSRLLSVAMKRVYGDYDPDDYGYGRSDGDNDDRARSGDRDGDADSKNRSYYDNDDRTVLRFGHAASVSDRRTITNLVRRYLGAAAASNGASACKMIMSSIAATVPESLGRPPGGLPYASGDTCAVVLSKIFSMGHRQLATYSARLKVASIRLKGNSGLIALRFPGLAGRQIGLVREAGRWKIDDLVDAELP